MPRALVTGATGLVGSHLVERLRHDGWDVRALARPGADVTSLIDVEIARGDVLDADAFLRAAAGVDTIFHTAAVITGAATWEAYRRLNIDGAATAVAAAERSGARLVQLSSVAVYGPGARFQSGGGKTSEDTPLQPLPDGAYYARSKRESEQLVLDAHAAGRIWATALRPDVIYGTRDRQFVPRIARLLSRGFAPIIGGGRSTLAIVHAGNVADGVMLAATSGLAGGRAYNLANDFDVTVREMFELGADGLGRRVRFVHVPTLLAKGAIGAGRWLAKTVGGGRLSVVANTSLAMLTEDNPFTSDRAKRELGWFPRVHPRDSIPEAFRWWKTHRRR